MPVGAAIFLVHFGRRDSRSITQFSGQQISETRAFSGDVFEPAHLRGGKSRLRFAHPVVRCEAVGLKFWERPIGAFVAKTVEQRTESFVTGRDQSAVAAGNVLGSL